MYKLSLAEINCLTEEMRLVCDVRAGGQISRKIDAMKIARRGLDLTLKDAYDYTTKYWPDRVLNKFREDMLRMNYLSDQVVSKIHEDTSFKLEMKDSTATYDDLMRFLKTAWEEMHKPVELQPKSE